MIESTMYFKSKDMVSFNFFFIITLSMINKANHYGSCKNVQALRHGPAFFGNGS